MKKEEENEENSFIFISSSFFFFLYEIKLKNIFIIIFQTSKKSGMDINICEMGGKYGKRINCVTKKLYFRYFVFLTFFKRFFYIIFLLVFVCLFN